MEPAAGPGRPDAAPVPTPAQLVWDQPRRRQHKRPRGRRIWALSGVLTIGVLAVPLTVLIARAGTTTWQAIPAQPIMRHVTVPQPVTSVSVQSYGATVQVTAGRGSRVRVTEAISVFDPTQPAPDVTQSVTGGQLTLAAPACASVLPCNVAFTLTVPAGVSVTAVTQGGDIEVSGVASANLDSGGGNVVASNIAGALTIASGGGEQQLMHVGGPLQTDSGGGDVTAEGVGGQAATIITDGGNLRAGRIAVAAATISTGGGNAEATFATAPVTAVVSTDGGNAIVGVPGGPYALTSDSDGGPETLGIATSPAASRSLTFTTGGGSLVVEPSSGDARAGVSVSANPSVFAPPPPVRPVPPAPAAP